MALLNHQSVLSAKLTSIGHLPYFSVLESLPVLAQRDNNICGENLQEDLIFGKLEFRKDFVVFNHSLLLGKFNIYSSKCQRGMPFLQDFIARTRLITL